mmetsp:Transcript_78939/g.219491  ORF Transcript_78939/g.219491 Transcript_78939/m.219491 type:complete len:205 (+) Transcript_78939:1-615(+)
MIFSGLYGILRPYDEIQPLSLPVRLSTKLTNSKGPFLRSYWKEAVQKELHAALLKQPEPTIINCASEEDCVDVLDIDTLPAGARICSVTFNNMDSESANEAKGTFVRWALDNGCMTVEELLEFTGGDEAAPPFRVSPKNSNPDKIVFEKATGDSWGKRLKESGLNKGEFMQTVAKGKNRYMRTEINKAMAKEQNKRVKTKTQIY